MLEQLDREWKLTAPVMASAERFKASDLASDLARLEAVEYVNDQPTPEQLASYGLDQPQLTVQVTLSDSAEPPHVLLVGKQREMQPEFFAKLATSPSVFVIRKDLRDRLDQDSLSYRVKDLWTLTAEDIAQLTIERGTDRVELRREAGAWRITQPFDAPANQTEVRPILDSLASLRIEGYEAHTTDELDGYGLGQPALRLSFSAREGTGDRAHGSRHWTLLLGKPVPGKSEIYAKREDEPAIFRIADPLLRQAGRTALDLLDRRVLSVERRRVGKLERSGSVNWSATREGESWKIQAGDLSFIADQPTIDATLRTLETLLADRVAAYGPEVKLDEYGLQSPVDSLTVVLSGNSGDSTAKHVLRFGKEADGGGRYAAVDDSKAVFVVSAATARELTRGHLDYADRTLLKLEGAPIQTIRRVMKENDLELSRAGGWKITKPAEFAADEALLDGLTKTLSAWRAERVAAYQPGDLKPFGLDEPTAVLTIEFGEAGKTSQKIVKVGGPVDAMNPAGERYITVESSPIVGVVDSVMAKRLLAEPIAFRDRQLVRRMPEPDKATLQRGERKATFVKSQGTWRMTEPIATDAEHADLEEFVNSLYRLRADELVAEKPTPEKLAEYGLDSPSAVWRFYSGEKEVLALLLGKRDSTDQRVYARLGDGDIVFLLTPAVTTRA
ncbi:MAG: DUF4340 domain-containing protein, partial [Gemmataceae bacterium]|nr:DUF4340 domain-containing protein [Gemmataceae bacterium]